MQITAPMKNEMRSTMPMESTPSPDISFTYCFMNIRILSGRANERPMRMRYLPKLVRYLCISIFFFLLICHLIIHFSPIFTIGTTTSSFVLSLKQSSRKAFASTDDLALSVRQSTICMSWIPPWSFCI